MVKAGIIDPVKVTKSAVSNAASIAGMVLTTESTVVEIPQDTSTAEARRATTATATDRKATDPIVQAGDTEWGSPACCRPEPDELGRPSHC